MKFLENHSKIWSVSNTPNLFFPVKTYLFGEKSINTVKILLCSRHDKLRSYIFLISTAIMHLNH